MSHCFALHLIVVTIAAIENCMCKVDMVLEIMCSPLENLPHAYFITSACMSTVDFPSPILHVMFAYVVNEFLVI